MTKKLIMNFILFQIGWFACVLGGAHDEVTLGVILAMLVIFYHIAQADDRKKELVLLTSALIIGTVFETLMVNLDLAVYKHGQAIEFVAPFWIILMWPLFATTLNLSMRWLKVISPFAIAGTGALFAPFAYFAGNKMGAVIYHDFALSMTVIAIAWALLLPTLSYISGRFNGYQAASLNPLNKGRTQHV